MLQIDMIYRFYFLLIINNIIRRILNIKEDMSKQTDKALSYSTEKLKAFDFLVPILQGKVFLWIGIEGDEIETVFLCEPQQRNNEEISLWVHGIATKSGHGYKNWHPLLEDIKNFA